MDCTRMKHVSRTIQFYTWVFWVNSSISHGILNDVIFILQSVPGPPFVFGSFLVVCALLVAFFIPEGPLGSHLKSNTRRSSGMSERMTGPCVTIHARVLDAQSSHPGVPIEIRWTDVLYNIRTMWTSTRRRQHRDDFRAADAPYGRGYCCFVNKSTTPTPFFADIIAINFFMSLLLIAIVQVSHYNSNLKEDKNQLGSRNWIICVVETVGCDVAPPIRPTFFFLFFLIVSF